MNPWDEILQQLEKSLSPQIFSNWVKPASFSHVENSTLFVRVPSQTYRDWYAEHLMETLQGVIGSLPYNLNRIELICSGKKASGAKGDRPAQGKFDFDSALAQLNARFTFDQFVVGSSNQFAHAAAMAVSSNPSKSYNPLFLYGGVGMGKTHLMQAIGHALRARKMERVCYVSGEQFLNEMIAALRYERMVTFQDRYRHLDALLVDDVHFLGGKERLQEEFFHTFNALYEAQRQIVISSDRPPQEIPHLEERLRSRFEWGLMADIQPPDLETKIAILMRKAEVQGVVLPDDVALFIARKIRTSIRELEGSLTRLTAYASLTGAEIHLGMAEQVLRTAFVAEDRRVNIEAIQKAVADEFKVRISDLKARNNSKSVVRPRQIAMYLCRELSGASLPKIGQAFGGKHHTTVLHSVDKILEERKSDKELNRMLHRITDSLH